MHSSNRRTDNRSVPGGKSRGPPLFFQCQEQPTIITRMVLIHFKSDAPQSAYDVYEEQKNNWLNYRV